MAGLPDLLMDEACRQYENERPRSVSRYSYYGSEPSPWERYQGQPAPGSRTGYSGGFGRAPQRYPTQRYPYQGYFETPMARIVPFRCNSEFSPHFLDRLSTRSVPFRKIR